MMKLWSKANGTPVLGRLLYSDAENLEENPVYLRVSARAYGAPRGWQSIMWIPPEMTRAAGKLLGQIGILPLLLLLAPYLFVAKEAAFMTGYGVYAVHSLRGLADVAYIFGALLLYARAVEGESSALVRNFFRNGAADGWGEALRLTPLAPADYERGLFIGILQREARSLLVRMMFLTLVIAPVVSLWSLAFRVYNPFHPLLPEDPSFGVALRMTRFVGILGIAVYVEFMMISAINLALMLRGASMGSRRSGRVFFRIPQIVFSACVFVVAHLPGAAAYFLWTMNSLNHGRRMESADFGLTDARGLYFFVFANLPLAWVIVRTLLRRYEGEIGRRFAETVLNRPLSKVS